MAKATAYLLSDFDDFCPENAENYQSLSDSPAPSVIYAPERKRRKIGAVRKRLLDSIVTYLYSRSQKATSAEERDSFTLALAIMGAVRREDPDPFTVASYSAFGMPFKKYLKLRAERQWLQHQELVRCIPDYDPQEDRRANVVKASGMGGQTARGGSVHQMPARKVAAQSKPVRGVPSTAEKTSGG